MSDQAAGLVILFGCTIIITLLFMVFMDKFDSPAKEPRRPYRRRRRKAILRVCLAHTSSLTAGQVAVLSTSGCIYCVPPKERN